MCTILMQCDTLADIAVIIKHIERAIALSLKVAPLALQFTKQILLIAFIQLASAIRTTGNGGLTEHLGLLVYSNLKFGILDTIVIALENIRIFVALTINPNKSHTLKCRNKRRIGTLQGCIHQRDALRIVYGLTPSHLGCNKQQKQYS